MIDGKTQRDPLTQDFHSCGHCGAGYFQRSTNREAVRCPHCLGENKWEGGALLDEKQLRTLYLRTGEKQHD